MRLLFDFVEGDRFRTTERRLDDLTPLLRAIGVRMVRTSNKAFREQKLGKVAWRERSVPNLAGIVQDLKGGGQPKARRFQPRPALHDTGLLKKSITYRIAAQNAVEAGSALPYAGLHHKGGVSEALVPKELRVPLQDWFLSTKANGKPLGRIAWLIRALVKGDVTLRIAVPARPIVGLDDETRRDLLRIIARFFARRGRISVEES